MSDDRAIDLDRRISTREALRVIGVHRATVLRWIKQGKFPPKHPSGGWRRSDLERWLAEDERIADAVRPPLSY